MPPLDRVRAVGVKPGLLVTVTASGGLPVRKVTLRAVAFVLRYADGFTTESTENTETSADTSLCSLCPLWSIASLQQEQQR